MKIRAYSNKYLSFVGKMREDHITTVRLRITFPYLYLSHIFTNLIIQTLFFNFGKTVFDLRSLIS